MVRAGQANLPGNKQKIQMTHNPSGRTLSVLEICGLIQHVDHGKNRYYVPRVDALPLRVAFKSGVADRDRDTLRWIREISQLILDDEPARMRIFQEHQNAS